jgi:hypothetical protein
LSGLATVPSRFAAGALGCRQHEPPIAIVGWTEQLLWREGAERDPLTGWALRLIRDAAPADAEL